MKIYAKDFHCYACGANGDIFTFVMDMDNLTYREAFMILGGTYEERLNTNRFYQQRQRIKREIQRQEKQENEHEFREWRSKRLTQVCNILRLCDNAEGLYEPFSDEWVYLHELRQKNKYKYQILCFGSREEQEEMRRLNE